jgi:hypothetical protein
MQEDMTNIAYSNEYLKAREDIDAQLYNVACYQSEELVAISDKYSAHIRHYFYDSDDPQYPYNLRGREIELMNKAGKVIYTYHSEDSSFAVFSHQDGKDYFIFKRDLYGYSVLDLETMQDYHFVPAESFPPGAGETFIWCDFHYNPINNILAVGGCYWAGHDSIVLVDFSDPMHDNRQVDVYEFTDMGYVFLGDIIDFAEWNDTDLVVEETFIQEGIQQTRRQTIRSEDYMNLLGDSFRNLNT